MATIDVLMFEVGKTLPEMRQIENDLAGVRAAIGGGYVECVTFHLFGEVFTLWCDEDGMQRELPPNRYALPLNQVIRGTFFLAGGADDEGETMSLPRNHVLAIASLFAPA